MNQNPELLARDKIDADLLRCGWVMQDKSKINLVADIWIANILITALAVSGTFLSNSNQLNIFEFNVEEQIKSFKEIECRLIVSDKMEKSITQSL